MARLLEVPDRLLVIFRVDCHVSGKLLSSVYIPPSIVKRQSPLPIVGRVLRLLLDQLVEDVNGELNLVRLEGSDGVVDFVTAWRQFS